MAFKQHGKTSSRDELMIYEVKSAATENKPVNVLQTAINDSMKDEVRLAESLNAIKQRLYDRNDSQGVAIIDRFQDSVDRPYNRLYGAAAIITESSYRPEVLSKSDTSQHTSSKVLGMIVITGTQLMNLIHALYERSANEA